MMCVSITMGCKTAFICFCVYPKAVNLAEPTEALANTVIVLIALNENEPAR